jgi:hypothetical protein
MMAVRAVRGIYQVIVPERLRRAVHRRLDRLRRTLKAPRMVWGYHCPHCGWLPRTRVSDTAQIEPAERVCLGDNVFVGHFCVLDGTGGIEISEGVHLAARASISRTVRISRSGFTDVITPRCRRRARQDTRWPRSGSGDMPTSAPVPPS